MSIVSAALGVITLCCTATKCFPASRREARHGCALVCCFQQWKSSQLCKRATVSAALLPAPLGLQRSRRSIIASYTCFIPLLMPQPLGAPSTASPPCLLRNYILLWGSPRYGLLLVSEHGGEKTLVKRKLVCTCIKGATGEWEFY